MTQVTMQEWLAITALKRLRSMGISPSCQDIAKACGMSNRYQAYRVLVHLADLKVITFCGVDKSHSTMVLNYVTVGVAV